MKAILSLLIITAGLLFTSLQAQDMTIRVAILDSPNMPPKLWTWLQYEKAYLRGLDTAKFVTQKEHINIVYKNFFYGNDPLDVLNEVPKVKAWNPDLILGPHYSNQFLLLKNHFKDTLVVSSYASDDAIYEMPNNFYSLFPPDNVVMQAMIDFINTKFHNKDILIISRSDCKDCNSDIQLFSNIFKKINPNVKISQNNFVSEVDDVSDPSVLLKGYKKGDVIVMDMVNLYDDTDLISRLMPFLSDDPIFVSSEDNWGNPNNGLPISSKVGTSFQAYLVNPFYLDMSSSNFRTFTESYLNLYGAYPNEVVSYVTFMTLMSAINAVTQCSLKNEATMDVKQKVLTCYLKKLQKDPNWFRPHVYAIYQLEAGAGELVVKKDMKNYFPQRHYDTN